jgi:hypothetical protein
VHRKHIARRVDERDDVRFDLTLLLVGGELLEPDTGLRRPLLIAFANSARAASRSALFWTSMPFSWLSCPTS